MTVLQSPWELRKAEIGIPHFQILCLATRVQGMCASGNSPRDTAATQLGPTVRTPAVSMSTPPKKRACVLPRSSLFFKKLKVLLD